MQPVPPPPEIVITAPTLAEPASERLLGVSRITRERLAEAGSQGTEQLLREAAGVILFRRSDARSGQPTSQGVTLRVLGGNAASRALLVLDGVPQADPFGGWINWPAYDPAALAGVRVVRGGGAVADGPGALAGTIHLTSLSTRGLGGTVEMGSRGALFGSARAGVALGGGTLSMSSYAGRGDGFVPIERSARGPADRPSPYAFAGGRLRWAGAIASAVSLEGAMGVFDDRRERGLAFTDERNARDRRLAAPGRTRGMEMVGACLRTGPLVREQLRQRRSGPHRCRPHRTPVRRARARLRVERRGAAATGHRDGASHRQRWTADAGAVG